MSKQNILKTSRDNKKPYTEDQNQNNIIICQQQCSKLEINGITPSNSEVN